MHFACVSVLLTLTTFLTVLDAQDTTTPAANGPLITQWYCDQTVGCMYCWGTTCPTGKQMYTTRDDCHASAECAAASAPKFYCSYCTPQARMVCYMCREDGCPPNLGTTYTNVQDCMASTECKGTYTGDIPTIVQNNVQ